MSTWDYAVLTVSTGDPPAARAVDAAGEELYTHRFAPRPGKSTDELWHEPVPGSHLWLEPLAVLGAEGWELSGVVSFHERGVHRLLLKRPAGVPLSAGTS